MARIVPAYSGGLDASLIMPREDAIAYAKEHNVPATTTKEIIYSQYRNL